MGVRVYRRIFQEAEMPADALHVGSLPEEFGMYEHLQPAREGNLHSDVLVPIAQASITGVLVASVLSIATFLFITTSATVVGYLFIVASVSITAGLWIRLMSDRNRLLWKIERITGKDFDGDGYVGEPETLRIELSSVDEHGAHIEFLNIPGDGQRFKEFACGVLNGKAISTASWTGRGGIYSRREFNELRDALLNRGWLMWRNPHAPVQGVMLTRKGREAFERICSKPPTPTEARRISR